MVFTLIILGVFAGSFAGILGISVGSALVPCFQLLGLSYIDAIESSLFAVLVSNIPRLMYQHKKSGVEWEPSIIIAISGIISAAIGEIFLIHLLPIVLLQLLYVGYMFLTVDVLKLARQKLDHPNDLSDIDHSQYFYWYVLCGAIAGFASTLLGAFGSIFMVAVIVNKLHLRLKDAYKIILPSGMIIVFYSLSSEIITHALPLKFAIPATIGTLIGRLLGSITKRYIPEKTILKINYTVCFSLGFIMLLQLFVSSLRV